MKSALPTLRVTGGLGNALSADALAQLGAAELTGFLLQRRWFGGKGRVPSNVRIGDVIELRDGASRFAVARLDVEVGGGRASYYQLPLAVRREGDAGPPDAVLARVESADERGLLFDAVEDEGFRRALGSGFTGGATFGDGSRWIIEPVGDADERPSIERHESRTVRAEQSNTSIIFGDVAILKLFRRMESGVNPDVEIGRFLTTKARFAHTPPLLGVIRYEGKDGIFSVAGMLQGFLPGSRDAWQHALEQSRGWFADPSTDAAHPFERDAERLGRITRELHDALAMPSDDESFGPRPATHDDVAAWAASARRRVEDATALLAERVEAGAVKDDAPARSLLDAHESYLAHVDELVATIGNDAGQLIRHHGDYHLGQVLSTRDGDFQVIDFEGEPARPLAERRERSSALRDVAGMLRSFAYAAATLAAEQRGRTEQQSIEPRAAQWERGARSAFLRGYLAGPRGAFLPSHEHRVDALLELFETEKVFYEMSYELNNRPDWVWIPITGAAALRASTTVHR